MKRFSGWRNIWLLVPAILLFWWLALSSMVDDSPTVDEQNHLARGAAFVRTGDPRLSLEHPPLVNALSALPLFVLPDVMLPLDQASWQRQPPDVYWYHFAEQFLWVYNHDVTRMIFLARLPIVFLTIGLALVGYHFAGQLWDGDSRIWAFLFLLFDPNLLAHGRYSTTDLGGTAFLFLATFLLWRMWQADGWHWRRWLWAGIGMGLAFGSKLSTLVFVPILGLLAVLPLYGEGTAETQRVQRFLSGGAWRRLGQFVSAGMASVFIVWAIFGFEWGPFLFKDDGFLVGLNARQGPMPTFWAGLEQVLFISSGGRPAYLLGHFSNEGFWNYFPVAFLVKTPLVTIVGLGITAVLLLRPPSTRKGALFLFLPAIFYFLFSMQSALNIGYRHLLPILPFLYVAISGVAGGKWQVASNRWQVSRITPLFVFVGLLMADFAIHPHYLSYFNVAAGGPENGRNILIDSNIDWGQDLIRLQRWMDENEVESVKLGWFGTAVPEYYGIHYEPIPGTPLPKFYSLWGDPPFDPAAPEPGIYAISVTSLWELPLPDDQKYVYPWFRAREPDDQIGYSILIYEVP
jgi:4-amino-4-deoxy-L-arabinose transferase-like glycosyltransferase